MGWRESSCLGSWSYSLCKGVYGLTPWISCPISILSMRLRRVGSCPFHPFLPPVRHPHPGQSLPDLCSTYSCQSLSSTPVSSLSFASDLLLPRSPRLQTNNQLFPGLIYRMMKPKVVLLIFVSGKIVLTGAKVREEIYMAFNQIYSVLVGMSPFFFSLTLPLAYLVSLDLSSLFFVFRPWRSEIGPWLTT